MTTIDWTHPSVLALLEDTGDTDPFSTIEHRAREIVLTALEEGWSGPPYDPFQLADSLGIELVAREELDDARLVSLKGRPRIEFNPTRRQARVRFSIAHEIGHFLFPDYGARVRYRDSSAHRGDDWQLEILCNIAAAEFLMPVGALPIARTADLSLAHLLDQRARFGVSTEALLRRAVKLTDQPAAVFAAARLDAPAEFRVDYVVRSRVWAPPVTAGDHLPATSVLNRCTAVGFSDDAIETWGAEQLYVQVVGVPPYPGDTFPRLAGLVAPTPSLELRGPSLRYVRGDATQPRGDAPAILAHVVNDRARSWGGRGFARSLMDRFPDARDEYAGWAASGALRRGAVHLAEAGPNLWVASLVAQAGYGDVPAQRPRLNLRALREALETLAHLASERGAEVHMPAIGTGQAGGRWPEIRDLILEELADRHVAITVYIPPDAPMPEDAAAGDQLSLL